MGNGGVRVTHSARLIFVQKYIFYNTFVTHSARDPRAIVDYSDVDSFAVVDFDF